MKKYTIQIVIPDVVNEPPRISIVGDVEEKDWIQPFMYGVNEMLDMLRQMYGADVIDKALQNQPG